MSLRPWALVLRLVFFLLSSLLFQPRGPMFLKYQVKPPPWGGGWVDSSRSASLPTRPANLLALTYEFRGFSRCAHTKATAGTGKDLDLAIGDFNEKKFTRAASCFDLRVLNAG